MAKICVSNLAELTSSSLDSSSLTLDCSEHKQCECVAQADEMHHQYLNRLEASFVAQLHRSTSWLARWPNRSMNRNLSVNQPGRSEGSGQNFVYEDCDNDATFRVKKLKLSVADTSSADQIVLSSEMDAKIQPIIGKIPAEDLAHKSLSQSLSAEFRNSQSFHRGR